VLSLSEETIDEFLDKELAKGEHVDMLENDIDDDPHDKIIIKKDIDEEQEERNRQELLFDLKEEKKALEEELEKIKTALDTVEG